MTLQSKWLRVFFVIAFCFSFIFSTTTAYAANNTSSDAPSAMLYTTPDALLVGYHTDEGTVVDNTIAIYHIGFWTSYGNIALFSEYGSFSTSIDWTDENSIAAFASALADAIKENATDPSAVTQTDANGYAHFTNYLSGAYFVQGTTYETEDYIYTPVPSIILVVPNETPAEIELKYVRDDTHHDDDDDDEEKKDDEDDNKEEEKKIEVSVHKVWKDGNPEDRPTEIQVSLYRDGILEDTQVLNDANNWSYVWTELEEDHVWTVSEDSVPEGYTLKVTHDGNAWTLTNENLNSHIIQTGQLRWPIAVFSGIGITLIVFGLILRRKRSA